MTPGPGATTGATGADDGGNGASLPGLDEQLDRVEGEPTAVYTALATFESALRDALDAVGRHVVRTRLSADVDAIPSRAPSFLLDVAVHADEFDDEFAEGVVWDPDVESRLRELVVEAGVDAELSGDWTLADLEL